MNARAFVERLLEQDEAPRRTNAVLAEPNSPQALSSYGAEKPVPGHPNLFVGQFQTMRGIQREDGTIVAGAVFGRRSSRARYQLLAMETDAGARRRGHMRTIFQDAVAHLGRVVNAAEYSTDGRAFAHTHPQFFIPDQRPIGDYPS